MLNRILNAKRQQQANDFAKPEPMQFAPFGEAYELVKQLVVEGGFNVNAALAYHNVKVTLEEHRALQIAANERDQYTIAR